MDRTTPSGGPRVGDAFGLGLLEYLEVGSDGREHFIERDDGLIESMDPGLFFTPASDWQDVEAAVSDRAGRRVLDVGAGAGRYALPLQEAGHDVVALDISLGAIEVCRRRGLRHTFSGTVFELVETDTERFDTFLLCGNNYGMIESPERAPKFFAALTELSAPGAQIIGTCIDPLATDDPLHLAYHERNRSRGRPPGQARLRSRWADLATPWFDWLLVPVEPLEEMAAAAGWQLVTYQPGPGTYIAILRLP